MNTIAASLGQARKSQTAWFAGIAIFLVAWFAIYNRLLPFAQWLVAQMPIEPGSHLASSVEFFFYDTPKVLMLLTLVVFAMGVIRSFFSPERTRALLAGKREGLGNIAGRPSWHRHAVLLLLGGAAVRRLRVRRRTARRDLLVPDRGADGQRGCPWTAFRPRGLEGRADLSRFRAWGGDHLGMGDRPTAP